MINILHLRFKERPQWGYVTGEWIYGSKANETGGTDLSEWRNMPSQLRGARKLRKLADAVDKLELFVIGPGLLLGTTRRIWEAACMILHTFRSRRDASMLRRRCKCGVMCRWGLKLTHGHRP